MQKHHCQHNNLMDDFLTMAQQLVRSNQEPSCEMACSLLSKRHDVQHASFCPWIFQAQVAAEGDASTYSTTGNAVYCSCSNGHLEKHAAFFLVDEKQNSEDLTRTRSSKLGSELTPWSAPVFAEVRCDQDGLELKEDALCLLREGFFFLDPPDALLFTADCKSHIPYAVSVEQYVWLRLWLECIAMNEAARLWEWRLASHTVSDARLQLMVTMISALYALTSMMQLSASAAQVLVTCWQGHLPDCASPLIAWPPPSWQLTESLASACSGNSSSLQV